MNLPPHPAVREILLNSCCFVNVYHERCFISRTLEDCASMALIAVIPLVAPVDMLMGQPNPNGSSS